MADLEQLFHVVDELTADEVRQLFAYIKKTHREIVDNPSTENNLYDDDPRWNELFAKSQDVLAQLAEEALKDLEEGRTIELDPDNL